MVRIFKRNREEVYQNFAYKLTKIIIEKTSVDSLNNILQEMPWNIGRNRIKKIVVGTFPDIWKIFAKKSLDEMLEKFIEQFSKKPHGESFVKFV